MALSNLARRTNAPRTSTIARATTALPQQFKAVKPVGDRVFVKVDREVSKSIGGVLLPTGTGNKPTSGAVIAAGDVKGVKLGDRVVYSKYAGTEIEVGPEPHVLLKEDDCIGVMPPSDKIASMQPLGDRILIKCAKVDSKTASGLLLNTESAEKPNFGTVVSVGSGRPGEDGAAPVAPNVAVGATVMYSKYSGTEFEEDDDSFIVVRESDILAQLS